MPAGARCRCPWRSFSWPVCSCHCSTPSFGSAETHASSSPTPSTGAVVLGAAWLAIPRFRRHRRGDRGVGTPESTKPRQPAHQAGHAPGRPCGGHRHPDPRRRRVGVSRLLNSRRARRGWSRCRAGGSKHDRQPHRFVAYHAWRSRFASATPSGSEASEGTVEDVGFRSTRIRTPDNSLVTIPSSAVVNTTVENLSLRTKRRQRFFVQVTYDTSREKVEELVVRIRQLIVDHPLAEESTCQVRFNNFGESSLDILVMFHLQVADYATRAERAGGRAPADHGSRQGARRGVRLPDTNAANRAMPMPVRKRRRGPSGSLGASGSSAAPDRNSA